MLKPLYRRQEMNNILGFFGLFFFFLSLFLHFISGIFHVDMKFVLKMLPKKEPQISYRPGH